MLKFSGMNISSKDPKRLALFYRDVLGVPMLEADDNFDGVVFGNTLGEPAFWIWDEKEYVSNTGNVTFVFSHDDPDKLYEELKQKGVELDPPKVADWGGKELIVKDPDGNTALII